MALTGAERQAAYKARRGRQMSIPLCEAAWSRLEELSRDWGLSQRGTLEKLLTTPAAAPAPASPVVTGELYLLRQDYTRLEQDYRSAQAEIRRLEARVNQLLIQKIAAQRSSERPEPSAGTVTGNGRKSRPGPQKGGA
jgi:hypothetical protein